MKSGRRGKMENIEKKKEIKKERDKKRKNKKREKYYIFQ